MLKGNSHSMIWLNLILAFLAVFFSAYLGNQVAEENRNMLMSGLGKANTVRGFNFATHLSSYFSLDFPDTGFQTLTNELALITSLFREKWDGLWNTRRAYYAQISFPQQRKRLF